MIRRVATRYLPLMLGTVFACVPSSCILRAAEDSALGWGETSGGLQCRAVPVSASMSEDDVSLEPHAGPFESIEDLAFAVEVKNVSDGPIQIRDTRYDDSSRRNARKAASDRFGPELFVIDYLDADGNMLERPVVAELETSIDNMLTKFLRPDETHQFLLRPGKWLVRIPPRPGAGQNRAVIRYQRMPRSGEVSSAPVEFELLAGESPLAWGEPLNGLRAALDFIPSRKPHHFGDVIDPILHIENVSQERIVLPTELWLINAGRLEGSHESGGKAVIKSAIFSGTPQLARITLLPGQRTAIAGGGLMVLKETEDPQTAFRGGNRALLGPPGVYTLRMSAGFGHVSKGIGRFKEFPHESDWVGGLRTGDVALVIEAEPEEPKP